MFTRNLHNSDPSKVTKYPDPAYPNNRMADFGYGKQGVKLFQLKKDGPVHTIIEYKIDVHMRLNNHKEYYNADNTGIIGSDVMETLIYIHAQKYGIRTPEEFALSLTKFYLDTYETAIETNMVIEEIGWNRLGTQETQGYYKDKPHNHVFLQSMNGRRRCEVVRRRDDPKPLLIGGITELRILKTTRAAFVGYVQDPLLTEGDNPDRVLSANINAKWEYNTVDGIDFNTHWHRVRDILIHSYAEKIVTSVQYYGYTAQADILEAMPEIKSVLIDLKNIPQVPFDFSRFPPFEPKADVLIIRPVDEPYGVAYVQTDRLKDSKL